MSKRHLRQVCERHSVISVGSDVSLKACLWSYQQPRDNRWWRRKGGGANTQGQDGNVRRLPQSKSAEGSEGRAWAGSSARVVSFKFWIFILVFTHPHPTSTHPPLLPNFPSLKSFSTCRTSSSRYALTGPSCVLALWPTALFDFVFVCATRGGVCVCEGVFFSPQPLKDLIFVTGLSDLCSLHHRSTPALGKWQRLMRATSPSDRCPPRPGICSVREQAGAHCVMHTQTGTMGTRSFHWK